MKRPLRAPRFEPSYQPFALDAETVDELRKIRNRRKRDRKAGRRPTPWGV